jgi:hypothetical protein
VKTTDPGDPVKESGGRRPLTGPEQAALALAAVLAGVVLSRR